MGIFSRVFKRRQASEPSGADGSRHETEPTTEPTLEMLDPAGAEADATARTDVVETVGPAPAAAFDGPAANPETSEKAVEERLNALFQARELVADWPAPGAAQDAPTVGADPAADASGLELDDREAEQTLELFGSIAALYVRPVQQFVGHLRQGPYSSEGVEMCVPAVEMVMRSAESMGAAELVPLLEGFNDALNEAVQQDEPTVDGTLRERILASYAELEAVLPEAFTIEEQVGPAEDIILYSLLRQIPDVGTVTLDKVFGAGLTSVDMFELATPKDLAVTAGIPEHLAQRICVRVHGYIVERRATDRAEDDADRLTHLGSLLSELEAHHDSYEDLRDPDEDPAEARGRRRHRRARLETALKVNVVLAELSQRELVDELQKLPFAERIARLKTYLENARSAGGPA